jgi:redox-sensitive bicupin YhaK (pirin superfamily)
MSFEKYPYSEQASGSFDNGRISENKPIGFLQDKGKLTPYSSLFYWASAQSKNGGLISEHSHRGFEIMTVVLKGQIAHFDSEHNSWINLNKGDVQIIRSGKGISHAEKFEKNARIFQIWFDPDLKKTWFKKPSYSKYSYTEFPIRKSSQIECMTIMGKNSPVFMDTQNVKIQKIKYQVGMHEIDFDADVIYSVYVLKGNLSINETLSLKEDDFLIVENESISKVLVHEAAEVFVVASASRLRYRTFAELFD